MDKNGKEHGRRDIIGGDLSNESRISSLQAPLTPEEWNTVLMTGSMVESSSFQEILDPFYRYFRSISVSRAVPKVTMMKSISSESTVLEIMELFAREEIVDILLVNTEEEESLDGVWSFMDVITVLLYGNGSKFGEGIFTLSVKNFREKVLGDKKKALQSYERKRRKSFSKRNSSGDISYPESEESEEEESGNHLTIPRSRPRAVSDGNKTKPYNPIYGGGDVIPIDRRLDSEHRKHVDFETPPTAEDSEEEMTRTDSSGSFEHQKRFLPRGVMSKVVAIRHNGTLWQAILIMFKFKIHRLVVMNDERNAVYMLTAGQILNTLVRDSDLKVGSYLEEIDTLDFDNKDLQMCRLESKVYEVLLQMHAFGNCFSTVVDNEKDRHVQDIVTKADIMNLIQVLFNPQNPNYRDQILQLENMNLNFLLEQRRKKYLRNPNELEIIRQRGGAKLYHEDIETKRPFYRRSELRSDTTKLIKANIEKFSVNGGTSFGDCLSSLMDNQMNRLMLVEERTWKLLGTISPYDVLECLVRHFKEDMILRKFSLADIPFLRRKR